MTGADSTETTPQRRAPGGGVGAGRRLLALLALPLLLGACSSLFFDDEDLEPQRIEVTGKQVEEPGYPNLASVPEQVPQPSPSAQRQELAEGLSADRQHARYSDEPLTPDSVAAEASAASDLAYPPPPVLTSAEEGTTVSQTAASAPPPPQMPQASQATQAAPLDEPAMPSAPATPQAASQSVPEGGFTAPPPPAVTAAGENLAEAPDVPAPPSTTDSATLDSGMADSGDAGYGAPTGLLQERAFQQQAAAAQRLQQIAAERRAFDEQARQQAIEQQWQREQLIQQHQAQWRYPAAYQQLAAAPTAAAAPYQTTAPYPAATAAPVAAGQLVGLIYFGHGSAQLDARDREVLQQVAALQQSQGRGLRVIGHASARAAASDMAEHEAKNRAMSMRRAQAVAEALVSLGADGGSIAVDSAGDAQPVFHEFTSTGEAGNRRVEIFLE